MIACCHVFNVWPKTTLLLPVRPRDAQRLDTPVQFRTSEERDEPKAGFVDMTEKKSERKADVRQPHGDSASASAPAGLRGTVISHKGGGQARNWAFKYPRVIEPSSVQPVTLPFSVAFQMQRGARIG